jgi:hypothetical protein
MELIAQILTWYVGFSIASFVCLFWAISTIEDHAGRIRQNALDAAQMSVIPGVNIAVVLIFLWVMSESVVLGTLKALRLIP